MTEEQRKELWSKLLDATDSVPIEYGRESALAYRSGLLDAWCIVTGEESETAYEKLHDSWVAKVGG